MLPLIAEGCRDPDLEIHDDRSVLARIAASFSMPRSTASRSPCRAR
jgi:hypothetical protein